MHTRLFLVAMHGLKGMLDWHSCWWCSSYKLAQVRIMSFGILSLCWVVESRLVTDANTASWWLCTSTPAICAADGVNTIPSQNVAFNHLTQTHYQTGAFVLQLECITLLLLGSMLGRFVLSAIFCTWAAFKPAELDVECLFFFHFTVLQYSTIQSKCEKIVVTFN